MFNWILVDYTYCKCSDSVSTELEFLKSQWGLGTEEEWCFRTGPPDYMAGGIHSLESMPRPHKRALYMVVSSTILAV
jgi:hypothetical protein